MQQLMQAHTKILDTQKTVDNGNHPNKDDLSSSLTQMSTNLVIYMALDVLQDTNKTLTSLNNEGVALAEQLNLQKNHAVQPNLQKNHAVQPEQDHPLLPSQSLPKKKEKKSKQLVLA